MNKLNTNFKPINLKEYMNELSSNPKLAGIDVTINNINTLQLYLDETSHCDTCKGLNECPNKNKGYTSRITNNGDVRLTCHPCKYQNVVLKHSNFKTLYLPDTILSSNFDDFRLDTDARKKAYKFAHNFAQSFKNGNANKGLYVCGNFQIGKTYFLAATASLLAQNDIDSVLIYFPDLVRYLKSSIGRPEFEEKINLLKNVDVLMLDDLGAEMSTPWVRDEILCPILNYRLQTKKPIFISSNLKPNELNDHYTRIDGAEYNARRLSERILNLSIYLEFTQ